MSIIDFPGGQSRDLDHLRARLQEWVTRVVPGPRRIRFDALVDEYLRQFEMTDPFAVDHPELRDVVEQFMLPEAPTTTPPCPSWCRVGTGHEWVETDATGRWWRWHRVTVGMVGDTIVELAGFERLDVDGTVTTDSPDITMWDVEEAQFDAAGARQLAAELLNAADRLDQLS